MDSEGAGCNRGGLGIIRRIENLGEGALLSTLGENAIIPPYGASGGYSGARMVWNVIRKGERITPFNVPGKVQGFPLEHGDVLEMKSTGGGGYGDPLDREVEKVRWDALNGYISIERARDVYGVIINPENFEVDSEATLELRKRLKVEKSEDR